MFEKLSYPAVILLVQFIVSCNWTGKEQNLRGLYGRQFCLDVVQTETLNNIRIGNGKLTLKENRTFEVTNDSLKYSNIKGSWDICCYDSDYGNYIFEVNGMKEWKTDQPDFISKLIIEK